MSKPKPTSILFRPKPKLNTTPTPRKGSSK